MVRDADKSEGHHVVVQNRRVRFEFSVRRNITIVRGDSANWEAVLASASACIVFLDEDVSAAKTPEFARRVRESDNY